MSSYGCCNVWCKSAILCLLLSSHSLAEIIDFEGIDLSSDYEGSIRAIQNETIVHGPYQITVWEGFVMDDAYYANQYSTLYPGKTLHPTKSAVIGESNNVLLTQRFTLKRENEAAFYLCRMNVAEKALGKNVQPLLITATYIGNEIVDGQLLTNQSLQISTTKHLDGVTGYEQLSVDFGRAVTSIDFLVMNPDGSPGQLMFDDVSLEALSSNCSQ